MAIELIDEAPADESAEIDPGQLAYEALTNTFAALDSAAVMNLVGAIQQGSTWSRISAGARAACVELERQLFAEE